MVLQRLGDPGAEREGDGGGYWLKTAIASMVFSLTIRQSDISRDKHVNNNLQRAPFSNSSQRSHLFYRYGFIVGVISRVCQNLLETRRHDVLIDHVGFGAPPQPSSLR